MIQTCEACENAPADTIESCDDRESPYQLCSACHARLHARALRPAEWYNLAKRHGWWLFLLHDDFYDQDGTASQPETVVDSPKQHTAPTLAQVCSDPTKLLDFTITRWHLDDAVANAWRLHERSLILQTLARRFAATTNTGIRARMLEVAAATLGEAGGEFVRYAWGDYPNAALPALAQASAACLPHREGFDRVVDALSVLDERRKRELMVSLSYFHSEDALDWIEDNVFSPITDSWGYLAAASEFSWPRAEKWLASGRPLSLVALDALGAILRPRSPLLRSCGPRLLQPPRVEALTGTLTAHAERDPAPRVRMMTRFILQNLEGLLRRE